jgi:hypothetical protein
MILWQAGEAAIKGEVEQIDDAQLAFESFIWLVKHDLQ